MKNINENKLFEFWDDKLLGKVLEKIREFSAKDFTKFSAITAICFSIAIWITRSLGYFYTLGRFSVYHIDKGYIDVWTEGFLIQVIQSASTCILLLVINYIYFQLSIPKQGKNVKRSLKKIGFIFLEFIVLSAWSLFANEISFSGLLKELPDISTIEILAFVIVWGMVLIMINAIGIEATIFYKLSIKEKKAVTEGKKEGKTQLKKVKKEKKKQCEEEESDSKQSAIEYQRCIKIIEMLLITCIIEFIFMYVMGILAERQRNEFKFVVEQAENVGEDEYVFTDPDSGVSYYLYPVIYENQDVYILSQLGRNKEGLLLNYDFQKVIDKKEVITYYGDNLKIEN